MTKNQKSFTELNVKEGKTIAIISYLTFIGLIIGFLMNSKKRNPFAAFHIWQMFFILVVGVVLGYISSSLSQESSILPLLSVVVIIFWINAFVGAILGKKRIVANELIDFSSYKKVVPYSIIGGILGLPLSYFFQPQMVRAKMSLMDYINNFSEIADAKEFIDNIILSVIVFAIIGGAVGYFLDKNEKQKTN